MRALAVALLLAGCTSPADTEDTEDTEDTDTPTDPPVLSLSEIAIDGGWEVATDFAFAPGGDQFVMTGKDGWVGHFAFDGVQTTLLGQFQVPVHDERDCGLISVAVDPGFDANRHVYLGRCASLTHSQVVRVTVDTSDYGASPASEVVVVTAGDSTATQPWHNVGAMGFDDTGALWALFGDKTRGHNSQDLANPLGSLLRMVPQPGGGAEPAPGNPYIVTPGANPLIYAHGLRSPWRGTFDDQGRWWIGDVGSDRFEEVDLVTEPGQDFGWPGSEGPCDDDCDGVTDPVTAYTQELWDPYVADDPDAPAGTLRAVWVADAWRDRGEDPYQGRMADRVLFGDFCTGFVRSLRVDDDGVAVEDVHAAHLERAVAWRQGPGGYLYALTFGLCSSSYVDPDDPPPGRLYRVELEE